MSELDAAVTRTPRSPSTEPLRLIAEFADDSNGADALGEALRTACRKWGIWWVGEPAARVAHAQATWLLTNEHPDATHLYLYTKYEDTSRQLTIIVGDPGGMLPVLIPGEEWRRSLGGTLEADAFHHAGRDRRLRASMKVRAPWRVRIKWDLTQVGTHPQFTFEDRDSEDDVRGAVHTALCRREVLAAHWQGPDDRDDVWRESGQAPGALGSVVA